MSCFTHVLSTLAATAVFMTTAHAAPLTLTATASTPYDLAVTGSLKDVPAGETLYVKWADLKQLPTTKLVLTGEFVPGEQEVTALYLSDLWAALPLTADSDVLLATCTDGYASVYRDSFIAKYRPFLVLEINGQGPDQWPPAGLTFNPGPYVISVSSTLVPEVATLVDAGHKRPWGVNRIEIANYAQRFAPFYAGALDKLTPKATLGRELWVHSCLSCHAGPAQAPGGTKADRPFAVLTSYAQTNPSYLKAYVLNPQKMVSTAKMEAHGHYTEAELNALVAFLRAMARQP